MNTRVFVVALLVVTLGVTLSATSARAQTAPAAAEQTAPTEAATDKKPEAASAPAAVQAGLAVMGGPGFALSADGAARLHLGLDAGVGLDTNPYSRPTDAKPAEFNGDLTARIRPNISLAYPGSIIAFQGLAMLDYGFLPGLIVQQTRNLLLYQSLVSADLEINRGGFLSFAVGDTFSWNNDPGNVIVGTLFNRLSNQLRAGVGLRPGGGALQLRLGYAFDFTKFLDVQGQNGPIKQGALDNMMHSLQLRGDYKFLPKTGFFTVLSGGWHSYPFSNANPTSFPVSLLLGVQGQILAKLSGLASIGYANPLVIENGGVSTLTVIGAVGQAELQWSPTPVTSLGGGFQRSFTPAPLYQYLVNNRLYASFNQILASRFVIGVNAGYSILQFGTEQPLNSLGVLTNRTLGDRLDGHLDANAQVSYFIFDWLSVGVANRLNWRVTNAADVTVPGVQTNLGFIRNETLLLASARY